MNVKHLTYNKQVEGIQQMVDLQFLFLFSLFIF